ncbi:MAG: UPF0182 family protein [Elainellaceae cyanobacterium]
MANVERSPSQQSQTSRFRIPQRYWVWGGIIVGVLFLLDMAGSFVAESYWYQDVDYFQAFRIRLVTQVGLGLVAFGGSLGLLLSSQFFAHHHSWGRSQPSAKTLRDFPTFGMMRLWKLLLIVISLGVSIGIMLIYHGQIAINYWHPQLSLYQVPANVPIKFSPSAAWEIVQLFGAQPWLIVGLIVLIVLLLIYPETVLLAIALLMAIGFGIVMSEQWTRLLFFFNPTLFDQTDPLFSQDISFYVFQLPSWELLAFWLVGLFSLALVSIALIYLLSGNSLSQGTFPGFSATQLRHLYSMGGCLMLAAALSYWVDRYNLLYSATGVVYGASYTNVAAELPAYTGLSILALICGGLLLWRSLVYSKPVTSLPDQPSDLKSAAPSQPSTPSVELTRRPLWLDDAKEQKTTKARLSSISLRAALPQGQPSPTHADLTTFDVAKGASPQKKSGPNRPKQYPERLFPRGVIYGAMAYVAIAIFSTVGLPFIVQRVIVQPNELLRETPYIQHAIALTRKAFELLPIEVETFNPQQDLTYSDIENNELTINNIRLWDTRPLLETNRQLQRIRLYYEFPDADVDRYTITDEAGEAQRRQVIVAARELDYGALPNEAKTWVNEHLIYTHGYGFTMSPVNTVGDGGLPDYFIRGIEHLASSEAVRRSIPVGFPRIYFGELTDTYVMTQTRVRELDYPSGSENSYNSYDGAGGLEIGSYWKRLLFAYHLRDWRMLLSVDFRPESRLLYRRNIRDRVQAIAPFLRYDTDPYLVVADISQEPDLAVESADPNQPIHSLQANLTETPPNYLYWVIDGYTTTSRYPYSDPLSNDFNYIRNSVKVVVDAYNGTMVFYVADDTDPIIQSWSKIFPNMFQPLDAMPATLREHIRYPQDYYQVQSDHLMTYHMTDPQVFYNREDEWRAPQEIYANEQQVVEPYYLFTKLPNEETEEFILLRPFTPAQRRNMIAWLAARSDGDRYGTQLLYTFPKQELVFGPEQIEARINQDPVISQQISLWNREGSRAVQGNLLVIPIEQSLLYVEPLYLEAEQDQLPTLVRVIVVFENQIAMAPTLEESLNAIFRPEVVESSTSNGNQPAIIRSVNELTLPNLDGAPLVPQNSESGDSVESGEPGAASPEG